jgi:formiminoglutamase
MSNFIDDLFRHTTRPNSALFYSRGQSDDPRLGDRVRWHSEDYANAKIVLLGCPQDEGVRRNGGRVGAHMAPDAIRECLYRLIAPHQGEIFDLGNTHIEGTLEETHDIQQAIVKQIIEDGKTLIILGGGNDISYPDCAGLVQSIPQVLAFNVDAHLDVRENVERNSGTPYRMLIEQGYLPPEHFCEMAYQPFAVAENHLSYVHYKGVHVQSLQQMRKQGIEESFLSVLQASPREAIFWGIDMDSVQVADAPGVSAPNPLGLTGDELCHIMSLAGNDPRSRILELTEVNPLYDIDQRTCRLAAVAIFFFLSAVYARNEAK